VRANVVTAHPVRAPISPLGLLVRLYGLRMSATMNTTGFVPRFSTQCVTSLPSEVLVPGERWNALPVHREHAFEHMDDGRPILVIVDTDNAARLKR
jgi:hypothetical protein